MLLALVASSVSVSSLSGFESDGFARGKGKWKLLEGTRAFSGLRSIVFRYGPRDRSSDGGIQAGVFGEQRFIRFAVGRVTYSDVIAFVELVCVERMRGVFVRRLPNLRFVDLIVGVLGHQRKFKRRIFFGRPCSGGRAEKKSNLMSPPIATQYSSAR